jgi:hypothetical protein
MPAERENLEKNCIGILNDETDEQRVITSPAKSDRVMKDWLVGRCLP